MYEEYLTRRTMNDYMGLMAIILWVKPHTLININLER